MKLCARCNRSISEKRLLAVPGTRLCMNCKTKSDEPHITAMSLHVRGSLVERSLSDVEESFQKLRSITAVED